jgi:integrase
MSAATPEPSDKAGTLAAAGSDPKTVRRKLGPIYLRGTIWQIQYSYRREQKRESSRSTRRKDAEALYKRRMAEIGRGRLIGPNVEKTTYEDLEQMLLDHYRTNRLRSLARVEDALQHLRGFFSRALALEITADRVTRYIAHRQEEKAANATINRELASLRRMFVLGERSEKVVKRPHIALLQEDNARKGFLEPDQFRAVVAELSEELRPMIEAAYLTGWRVRSELLTRQWSHVDFKAGWLRLEPGETKNKEGRQFPLIPPLRALLQAQKAKAEALAHSTGKITPWVFFRENGDPIKDFYGAWRAACRKVGVPGIVPHDLRRSAVRNLERSGVPRSVAMKMVGHKTEAIYRRYAIVAEADLVAGGEKLTSLHQVQGFTARSIIPFPESR